MAKEWITPMPWNNEGVAPSETLQNRGFQKGDGLPATIFNHAFYKTNQSITELQTEVGKMIPTYYASWDESPTMFIDYAIYTEEEIPADLEKYILMFHGWGGTTNEPVVTINDESYDIVGMDGNPLPEGAWTTDSLVTLNVDTVSKKAFFKLGSASLDFSFVTAGAENIQEGFVGINQNGEPVYGTRTTTYYQQIAEASRIVVNSEIIYSTTLTMPDFMPDVIIIDGYYTLKSMLTSRPNASFRSFVIVDFTNQIAWASGSITDVNAHTFEFKGNQIGAGSAVKSSEALLFCHDGLSNSNSCIPYSSLPFASLTAGESFTYNNTMNINNYIDLASSAIKLTAIKF
jgi:hypothetical protein